MIKIEIDFYDKKTKFIVEEIEIDLPEDMVFSAAKTRSINEINAFVFDVSEEMKAYIKEHFPELRDKFELYDYDFIGQQD